MSSQDELGRKMEELGEGFDPGTDGIQYADVVPLAEVLKHLDAAVAGRPARSGVR
jgi:hypothetical protein